MINSPTSSPDPVIEESPIASTAGCSQSGRNFWREQEVLVMLQIFQEQKILELFDGKRYRTNEIYELIEKKMKENGIFSKNAVQIKNKWKALKSAYIICTKKNSVSGAERNECEFFFLLDEILGSRPSTVIEGEDVVFEQITENQDEQTNTKPNDGKGKRSKENKKKEDNNYLQDQRTLMEEFFQKQNELEEKAARARSEEMSKILDTFTKTMKSFFQSPMLYGGAMPPFVISPQQKRQRESQEDTSSSSSDDQKKNKQKKNKLFRFK